MEWFTGSINDAIANAKVKGALFVVAIHGPTDESSTREYLSSLDSSSVGGILRSSGAVSIHMASGDELCRQFSAVYPVVVVPALYLIDSSDGVAVEVAAGNKTAKQLAESVKKAVESVRQKKAAASVSSPRGARVEAAQRTLTQATEGTTTNKEEEEKKKEATSSGLSLDERVARAKQLLAEKKAQKEEKENKTESDKELERRELGKSLQQQKRSREDEEARKIAEERRKDKEEEMAARERVKRQIELDRQERAARYNQEKERERQRVEEEKARKMEEEAKRVEREIIANSSVARIQFRLPDGRSQMDRFNPDDPLEVLYRFVEDTVRPGFSRFALSTTYPRRQLDREDRGKTLRDLGLVPTSTILIMPASSGAAGAGTGGGGALLPTGQDFFSFLLAPFTWLWGILSAFLFPRNPNAGAAAAAEGGSSAPSTSAVRSPPVQRGPPGGGGGSGFSREGNIARLRRREDDDDETNTYNGNSTQQM